MDTDDIKKSELAEAGIPSGAKLRELTAQEMAALRSDDYHGWDWAVKKLLEDISCTASVKEEDMGGVKVITITVKAPNGNPILYAVLPQNYDHVVQFIIEAFREGVEEMNQ